VIITARDVEPQVSRRTNPGMCLLVCGKTPLLSNSDDQEDIERALNYMGLEENQPMTSIAIDHVFIGSCTISRLSDLRKAASIVKGRKVHPNVRAIVVQGSFSVKMKAEKEGIDIILKEEGFA